MTPRKFFAAAGIIGLSLFALTISSSRAFDGKSSATQLSTLDETSTQDVSLLQKTKKKKRKKARGRLPNYYARVGISEEQRKKIYDVQSSYRDKIAALEQELKELKGKRDKEVAAVLTEEQRMKVEELAEAARKKRAERAKKRKKKSAKAKPAN